MKKLILIIVFIVLTGCIGAQGGTAWSSYPRVTSLSDNDVFLMSRALVMKGFLYSSLRSSLRTTFDTAYVRKNKTNTIDYDWYFTKYVSIRYPLTLGQENYPGALKISAGQSQSAGYVELTTNATTNRSILFPDGNPEDSVAYRGWVRDSLNRININGKFIINSSGNITKINNVAYSFPSVRLADSFLYDSLGNGNLKWKKTPSSSFDSTKYYSRINMQTSGGAQLHWNNLTNKPDALADGATKGISAFYANDFNSTSGVITIDYGNAQKATDSQAGFLSATDWSTFNGKQTALSGTGFVKISGTTISYDNSTYSLSNHNHSGTYEPAISKSTGYAKWTGAAWSFDNSTFLTAEVDGSTTNEIQTLGTSGNTITLTSGGSVTAPYATTAGSVTNGVYTTGNQSIAGDKTFSGTTTFNTGNSTTDLVIGQDSQIGKMDFPRYDAGTITAHTYLQPYQSHGSGDNTLTLPTSTGTLALTSDIPANILTATTGSNGFLKNVVGVGYSFAAIQWSDIENLFTNGYAAISAANSFSAANTTTSSIMFDGELENTPTGDANVNISGKNTVIFYMNDMNYTQTLTNATDGQILLIMNDKDSIDNVTVTPVIDGTSTSIALAKGKSALIRYRSSESTWYRFY